MSDLSSLRLSEFLDAVAAKSPTPGGGAVAGAVGAISAALARMVLAYSVGKKSLAEHEQTNTAAASALAKASDMLMQLAEEDAAAYALVNELQKLPEADPRRAAEWSGAVAAAVAAPRSLVGTACDMLRLMESLVATTNKHLRSDLAIAAILAEAAARGGAWNVAVNIPLVADEDERRRLHDEMHVLLEEAETRRKHVEETCKGSEQ